MKIRNSRDTAQSFSSIWEILLFNWIILIFYARFETYLSDVILAASCGRSQVPCVRLPRSHLLKLFNCTFLLTSKKKSQYPNNLQAPNSLTIRQLILQTNPYVQHQPTRSSKPSWKYDDIIIAHKYYISLSIGGHDKVVERNPWTTV